MKISNQSRVQPSSLRFAAPGSPESRVQRRRTGDCGLRTGNCESAFTLVELLVVLSIFGILAALVVPALKNVGHADAMTAATRQMLNDVARARQLAISQRTTVYMVFVKANFWTNLLPPERDLSVTTNLCDEQLTGYTFMSCGAMGDQPGQHQWHYLAPWQNLPDGTFIAQQKFIPPTDPPFHITNYTIYGFATIAVPIPTKDKPNITMPCIAFNYLGQLTINGIDAATSDEYIPLARGNVAPAMDPVTKAYQLNPPSIMEIPPGNSTNAYNIIDIEPLTGHATLQRPKMQ